MLIEQAQSNSKEQFANSPDLAKEMLNAIMDALAAHGTMSKQALDSPKLRGEMQDVLLGPGQLYEALRERGASSPDQHAQISMTLDHELAINAFFDAVDHLARSITTRSETRQVRHDDPPQVGGAGVSPPRSECCV